MKYIKLLLFALFLFVPGIADAVSVNCAVVAPFGIVYTGQSSNLVLTVTDFSGTTHTVTPTVTESTDSSSAGTGVYYITFTGDTSWALPLHAHVTITGKSGVCSDGAVFTDREAQIADGYTSSTATGIGATNTAAAKIQFDGSNYIKTNVQLGTVTSVTSAVTLPANAPSTFLANDTTANSIYTQTTASAQATDTQTGLTNQGYTGTLATYLASLPTAAQVATAILTAPLISSYSTDSDEVGSYLLQSYWNSFGRFSYSGDTETGGTYINLRSDGVTAVNGNLTVTIAKDTHGNYQITSRK